MKKTHRDAAATTRAAGRSEKAVRGEARREAPCAEGRLATLDALPAFQGQATAGQVLCNGPSCLQPPAGHGRQGYASEDYLIAASALEAVNRDRCHPDLYALRRQVAAEIRKMASNPQLEAHRRQLDAVRFFCYDLRFQTARKAPK